MRIAELTLEHEKTFDELALSCGNIFNTIGWTRIFGDKIRNYGIYNQGGDLMGGFFVYKDKKYGLSVFREPPFTPSIGPFLFIEAVNPVAIMDIKKSVLSLMAEFIDNLKYSVVSVSLSRDVIDMQPFIWRKYKVIPNYTYIIDLGKSAEEIWGGMSGERRKNVNKGLKDSLTVEKTTDMDMVKSLVLKSFERQKKCPYEKHLDKVLFEFANEKNSFAFATFNGGSPIACSFCVYDRKTAYYITGGFDYENRHHGAGVMAMWESIKYAKHLGLKYFDFEGSMSPKIEKYFRGFGGDLTPCYQINKAKLPLEIILKCYKRQSF
jgi:lipid II:glycine glycyltransferase (peptidoglycan interpeptide bridge formation enzyme)